MVCIFDPPPPTRSITTARLLREIQAHRKRGARPGALTRASAYFPRIILCRVGAFSETNSLCPRTIMHRMESLIPTIITWFYHAQHKNTHESY